MPPAPRRPARSIPAAALVLGAAGLVPFGVSAAVYAFGEGALAVTALKALFTYAAVILSFLGGVRWGVEIARDPVARWLPLTGSVAPPLVAWLLLLAPASPAWPLSGLLLAFLAQGIVDERSDDLPAWYRRLRIYLTLGATTALALALFEAIVQA